MSRFQSPSNRRGNGNEAGTVNTVEASPTSISDDDIVPASETSSDELETSSRQPLSTFTIKLRPRGCRGKESTERSKAKYDAKKAERNQTPIPIVSVPKRGKNNKCASIDPNGKSKNVSEVNNVANGRSENKLFTSLFPPTEHGFHQQSKEEKQALSSSSIDEVLSSRGEQEPEALDQTRVNSSKQEQDVDPHQRTNGFSSIGGEQETAVEKTTAPHQNRVKPSEDEEDAEDGEEAIIGQDHLEACGGDVVVPQV